SGAHVRFAASPQGAGAAVALLLVAQAASQFRFVGGAGGALAQAFAMLLPVIDRKDARGRRRAHPRPPARWPPGGDAAAGGGGPSGGSVQVAGCPSASPPAQPVMRLASSFSAGFAPWASAICAAPLPVTASGRSGASARAEVKSARALSGWPACCRASPRS